MMKRFIKVAVAGAAGSTALLLTASAQGIGYLETEKRIAYRIAMDSVELRTCEREGLSWERINTQVDLLGSVLSDRQKAEEMVASRVKSIRRLYITGISASRLFCDRRAKERADQEANSSQ